MVWMVFFILALLAGGLWACRWIYRRYAVADEMEIPVREYSNAEYPEDPANRSTHFGRYSNRRLRLIKRDETHFDFILEPTNSETAKIVFKNIDVSLMTPSEPEWTRGDPNLEKIALIDRQWNRQQVSFPPNSDHLEMTGGDGFEREHLYSADLSKNCLNAGLWEVLLFTHENGQKALYYQNWFTFPLGHYKRIFERNTRTLYRKHWYKLEHWSDPSGTPIDLEKLRTTEVERKIPVHFNPNESIVGAGEQLRKQRTVMGANIRRWSDFVRGREDVGFAKFIPPGRYSVNHIWKNEYGRLAILESAILRDIRSPAQPSKVLQELELIFEDIRGEKSSFIASGFDLSALPQLRVSDYPQGMYMPMGIGVPPFFQSYDALERNRSEQSPYFSVLLDSEHRWINHHKVAIDGVILHRDETGPELLHAYLLSYERHTLIVHCILSTSQRIHNPGSERNYPGPNEDEEFNDGGLAPKTKNLESLV